MSISSSFPAMVLGVRVKIVCFDCLICSDRDKSYFKPSFNTASYFSYSRRSSSSAFMGDFYERADSREQAPGNIR